MILSTRESAEMREILLKYGISQVSAGSCTGVGGYEEHIQGNKSISFNWQMNEVPDRSLKI